MVPNNPKIIRITSPDYLIPESSTRIFICGSVTFSLRMQDAIAELWSNEDVALYVWERGTPAEWLLYHISIVNFCFVEANAGMPAWVGPLMYGSNAEPYWVSNILSDKSELRSFLKMTFPNRVFNNEIEAVTKAVSGRT